MKILPDMLHLDKGELIKFLKSSASESRYRNFLKHSSTLKIEHFPIISQILHKKILIRYS